jgi:hypothetical protein
MYPLQFSEVKILVDAGAHSKHVQVIRWDIKPGSMEKSRDVESG